MRSRVEIGFKLMIVSAILAVGFALVKDVVSAGFFYCLSVFGGVLLVMQIIKSGLEEIKQVKERYAADKTGE